MSLSQTAYQYRDRQSRLSNPILLWGVVGSMVAHGGLLPLFLWLGQQSPLPEPARIEIIVTEPPPLEDEEPEPAQLSDRPLDEAPVEDPSPLEPEVEAAPTAALLPPEALPEPVDSPPETVEEELVADQLDAPEEESSDPEPSEAEENEAVEPEPSASATDADAEPDEPRASTPRATTPARRSTQTLRDRLQNRTPSNPGPQTSDRTTPPAETQAALPESSPGSNGSAAQESGGGGSRTVACQHCPSPRYPQSALDANIEGTVGIMVDISPSGAVVYANVVSSSGSSVLDQAAVSTVRGQWRFQPISGGANGVMVSVVMTISGSDLNRRAQEQGNRESLDLPSEPESADSTADMESNDRQDEDDSAESTTEPLPSEPEDASGPPSADVVPPEDINPSEAPVEPPPADPIPDPPAPEPPPEPVAPAPPVDAGPPPEEPPLE
ncbi:MAG: TonB family protein [Leptolyngbya sp. DLM2.Bin15]|nr:MAG: TonB family protein [Leptolyngbya sp. DLM2.Bin15]